MWKWGDSRNLDILRQAEKWQNKYLLSEAIAPYVNVCVRRDDLNPEAGTCAANVTCHFEHGLYGGRDMKVTNRELIQNLEYWAASGPTNQNVPPFRWSSSSPGKMTQVPNGMPDLWDFSAILHHWQL